jgi:hypothetical protein
MLQLLLGEILSRTASSRPSPFLACLSIFSLIQAVRVALPGLLSPLALTGKVDTSQRSFIFGLMVLMAVVFVFVISAPWMDLDLALGTEALKETGVFWSGVGQAFQKFHDFVRGRGDMPLAFFSDTEQPRSSSEPTTGAAAQRFDDGEQPAEAHVMDVRSPYYGTDIFCWIKMLF